VVREGPPVDVLVSVAEDEGAALLVVGSRGVGSAPALALGSTSLHLLQVSPVPVLVVPSPDDGPGHPDLRRILVGVDGATPSNVAIDLTCELAVAFGAWVELVNAVEEVPVIPLGPATTVSTAGERDAPRRARARIEPLRQQITACGVPVHLRVKRGVPEDVLRSTAALLGSDLIVLTSSHVGDPTDPLLATSVSRRMAALAHRPILVVPRTSAGSAGPAILDVRLGRAPRVGTKVPAAIDC
jgi:nucleotide-binding universal stress UspA family protein